MKTATAKSSRKVNTVRKVTSATAQIQHIVNRVRSEGSDARYRLADNVTAAEKALVKARRDKATKIAKFTDKYVDGLVMAGSPNLTATLRDFKAKLAAIR